MESFNPFGPPTPEQETELNRLLAGKGRLAGERIRRQVRGLDAGQLADTLQRLRGEPAPPCAATGPARSQADTRAANAVLREQLRASYAGRAMQPTGLGQPSYFAGHNGHSPGMLR